MFFDMIRRKKEKTVHIIDDMYLNEGECLNIHGENYSGKTSLCFSIAKNNPDKTILYVASEPMSQMYMNTLSDFAKDIYIVNTNEIHEINDAITKIDFDLLVLDSITALAYIREKKQIERLVSTVQKKRANMIIVSQMRNYEGQEYYEHKKLLNFYSYRIKVEIREGIVFLNNRNRLRLIDVWKK